MEAAIGLGVLVGLTLGILVRVTTELPLAPEAGLLLGALLGWLPRAGPQQFTRRPSSSTRGSPRGPRPSVCAQVKMGEGLKPLTVR